MLVEIALVSSVVAAVSKDWRLLLLSLLYIGVISLAAAWLPAGEQEIQAAGSSWYWYCIIGELSLIICCLVSRHPAGIAVALLSLQGIAWHWLALGDFSTGIRGPFWRAYVDTMPLLELAQACALVLFTPPARKAVRWLMYRGRKEDMGSWTARQSSFG